ncbi:MAG TPA: tripartite tricarboxylate transporter substrate binding protein [Methylomirabilota bacterium]|jgi:tripartite-type tricarboxylate transporter receptor subunit TctC|nr:tripartite tricarboxylate transporter substrate binding protein [Methylomirabilota bacterium]
MRRFTVLASLLIFALVVASAGLAAYPDRPVKLIVPWAAGGDTDSIFRPLAQQLQKYLGATVVIANVTGASGTAGAREAKGSPPDGYTLYAIHDYIHSTYYTGVADVAYSDFEPICSVSNTPSVLTASPKTKWSSWQELLADAKARPGQITVGATLGSTSHFFPALIEKAAGIKFKYVSYEGLAPRMNAILGGHIDLTDSNLTQKGKVEAGQLKFLAIGTDKRLPDAPSVPTLKELGVNVVYAVTRGVTAPKSTPADILAKLEAACQKATSEAKFAEDMAKQGTFVRFMDRKAYAAFLRENDELNKTLARDLGLLKR